MNVDVMEASFVRLENRDVAIYTPTSVVVIIENLIISLLHVAPIIFRHMDPTTFQTKMKNLCDVHVPI
jgi:hypothetical protein